MRAAKIYVSIIVDQDSQRTKILVGQCFTCRHLNGDFTLRDDNKSTFCLARSR